MKAAKFSLLFCYTLLAAKAFSTEILWPVSDTKFFDGAKPESFLQATASGKWETGGFGCVRSNGRKFHEGIDIKATEHDKNGEALNAVLAILPGKVAHVNTIAGNSSYGRYVVLEHTNISPPIYSLYAHLKCIDPNIKLGTSITVGRKVGVMGRSAGGYRIPKVRAHLHFEMGFMLSENFQNWYDKQDFTTPNKHNTWNGLNLMGFDPLDFYQSIRGGKIDSLSEYIKHLPTACTVIAFHSKVPNFIKRYPELLTRSIPPCGLKGWKIEFTWFGLPIRWTPLLKKDLFLGQEGNVALIEYNPGLFQGSNKYGHLLTFKDEQAPHFGKTLKRILKILFAST